MPELSSPQWLSDPAVLALIAQGAREGHVSYSEINDLLIDLELDESDVDDLLDALEKRAIKVSDTAATAPLTPKATAPQPQKRAPQPKLTAAKIAENSPDKAGNADLDSLLAQLDELLPSDVEDVAKMAGETGEELLDDEFAPVEDALKLYLNRMGQIPRLSPEEERELARLARDGSAEEIHDAQNKLVESNLRLVVHLAHHAAPRTTLSITDLLQEGNLGLLDAVSRYRPESSKTFGAYATWWIRRALNSAITEHSQSMKLSGELYNAIQKMQGGQRALSQTLGRSPSRQELADFTGLSVPQIEEAQRASSKPISLDAPAGKSEDGDEFGENLADVSTEAIENEVENAQARREVGAGLATLLDELSDREKLIVQLRFGLGQHAETGPRASEDVAKLLNISRERVHELELRALRKLRKKAKGSGLDKLFGDADDDE